MRYGHLVSSSSQSKLQPFSQSALSAAPAPSSSIGACSAEPEPFRRGPPQVVRSSPLMVSWRTAITPMKRAYDRRLALPGDELLAFHHKLERTCTCLMWGIIGRQESEYLFLR